MRSLDERKLEIRYTQDEDDVYLKKWLMEPGMDKCFPMRTEQEIDDSVTRWISFAKWRCSLTVVYDGEPVGLAALYLMPYRSLAHQCEWGLVLTNELQGKGIGTKLVEALMKLAKEKFNLELIHLQVQMVNEKGIAFFKKLGFREFGRQTHWLKENNEYRGRIYMERFL